jgi:hypothetical protein
MAALRCDEHRPGNPDSEGMLKYRSSAAPDRPILCSKKGCGKPAKVWLNASEVKQYGTGQRTFQMFNNAIQVQDGSIQREPASAKEQ